MLVEPVASICPCATLTSSHTVSLQAAVESFAHACERHPISEGMYRRNKCDEMYANQLKKICSPSVNGGGGIESPTKKRSAREGGNWTMVRSCEVRPENKGSVYLCGSALPTIAMGRYMPLYKRLCTGAGGGTSQADWPSGWQEEDMVRAMLFNLRADFLKKEAAVAATTNASAAAMEEEEEEEEKEKEEEEEEEGEDSQSRPLPQEEAVNLDSDMEQNLRLSDAETVKDKLSIRDACSLTDLEQHEDRHEPYFLAWRKMGPVCGRDCAWLKTNPNPKEVKDATGAPMPTSRNAQKDAAAADRGGAPKNEASDPTSAHARASREVLEIASKLLTAKTLAAKEKRNTLKEMFELEKMLLDPNDDKKKKDVMTQFRNDMMAIPNPSYEECLQEAMGQEAHASAAPSAAGSSSAAPHAAGSSSSEPMHL